MPIICPPPLSEIPTDALPPVRDEWDYTPLPKPIPVTEQRWPEGTRPLVTVRCITFNHERFIRQAIDGFLMQETTFPVQILVHDDASTDGTAAIVREYAERYPDLIVAVLQPENLFSKKRRPDLTALEMGRHIALCEGDDYWIHPEKLQIQCMILESNDKVSLSYHPANVLYPDGSMLAPSASVPELASHLEDFAMRGNYIMTATVVMRNHRTTVPREATCSPAMDYFWWMMQLERGTMMMVRSRMAVYRAGVGTWSSKSEVARQRQGVTVLLCLLEYFSRVQKPSVIKILKMRVAFDLRPWLPSVTDEMLGQWRSIGPACSRFINGDIQAPARRARRWPRWCWRALHGRPRWLGRSVSVGDLFHLASWRLMSSKLHRRILRALSASA